MAKRALIEILGDASSFSRSVKESLGVSKVLQADMTQLGLKARASADVQIAASVRKDSRLREELATYRAVAASAEKGSREQVVAANLAERAQKRLAGSLGVTAVESRRLSSSSLSAERDIGRASRGALAGSGIFTKFGRSLAFASGGFLAFAGGGQFLRSSIDAARQAAVVQRQEAAQLAVTGKQYGLYRGEIDKTTLSLSALSGFTKDQLDRAFTTILRTTGNVAKALRDTNTAAALSRAKPNLGLDQAATVIAKVEAGNTSLLRRQGFEIDKTATKTEALAAVRKALAGQIAAGTTEEQKFSAVLHDSEVIIGTGLLPTLNHYLTSGAKWLAQMNSSGRLQRDVNRDVKDAKTVLGDVRGVIHDVDDATGGFKHTLEALLALKTLAWARSAAIGIGLVGTSSTAATAEVTGLRGALSRLGGINPIVIPITLAIGGYEITKELGKLGIGAGVNDIWKLIHNPTGSYLTGNDPKGPVKPHADLGFREAHLGPKGFAVADLSDPSKGPPAGAITARHGLTVTQRNTFFDNSITRLLDRSQDGSLKAQIAKLQTISALISQRISVTKDVTRKLNLEDQLVSVGRTIRGDQAQLAQQVADKIKADKAAALAARQKRIAATSASEFKVLGLDATGNALIPGKAALKKVLGNVSDAVKGTFLDTSKTRSELAGFRKVLSESLVPSDVRQKLQGLLAGIDQDLKSHVAGGNQTKFRHESTTAILAGLGLNLTPAETRRARQVLSQIGAGGTVPGSRSQAFALAGATAGQTIVMHNPQFNGITDIRKLKNDLLKESRRHVTSRRN